MITFDSVSYAYPRQVNPALDGCDLQINDGDYLLITGPSGSGKSTIAHCVSGLVPHFHGGRFGGAVTVDGVDTRLTTTARLSTLVGLVGQDPESQTVTDRVDDEIAFGPENLGLSRPEIRLRVEEALDLLGIAHLRERQISTLSGGERQRVIIAAAMAMRPRVLILDEPTSQLDPWGAEEVLSVVERFNSDLGTTIILIEHRLDRVLGQAENLLILDRESRAIAYGPVRDVAAQLLVPPPVIELARRWNWWPVPVTVREARRAQVTHGPNHQQLLPVSSGSTSAAGERTVELERVTFAYGKDDVLKDISTTFQGGTVTALMGRNGSGKTTLLKQINGLHRPKSGVVRLFSEAITERRTSEIARQVGYLAQNPAAMLFNESVAAELGFTLRCQRKSGDIDEALRALGIENLARRSPFDLAGGERQRAALAAILIAQPRVLLLDEPTRGLDFERKLALARQLRQLATEGMTVILTTHDVELAAQIADRVLLLANGEIIADDTPRRVLSGSLTFATQTNRIFGGEYLTPDDLHLAGATPGS